MSDAELRDHKDDILSIDSPNLARKYATTSGLDNIINSDNGLRSKFHGSVKKQLCEQMVKAKFEQHPELQQKLLATDNKQIVEAAIVLNPNGSVKINDKDFGIGETGEGNNFLGVSLTEFRNDLQAQLQQQQQRAAAQPPANPMAGASRANHSGPGAPQPGPQSRGPSSRRGG